MSEQKWLRRRIPAAAVVLLVLALAFTVPKALKYRRGLKLLEAGDYGKSASILWQISPYRDARDLAYFASIMEDYDPEDDESILDTYEDFRYTAGNYSGDLAELVAALRREVDDAYPAALERKTRADAEAKRLWEEQLLTSGRPYVGMSEAYIRKTSLGEPAPEVRHNYQVKNGQQYLTNLYDFTDEYGNVLLTARCAWGEVIQVWEGDECWPRTVHSGSGGGTHRSSSDNDPYNAGDYANAEDFYDFNYDDFIDYDEAEEYWEENSG